MNGIFIHINLKNHLLLLALLFAKLGFSGDLTKEIKHSRQVIEKFVTTGDTTGLDKSLFTIGEHFNETKNPQLLELMLKVSSKEARLDKRALKKLYFILRNFYDAETAITKNFEYSLKIYKILSQTNDHEGLMWILIDIGNIFYSELDYDQAFNFYQKAEIAAKKSNLNYGLSIIYMNYGMIEERRKNHEKSLEYYQVSSKYRLKTDNIKVASSTYIKIALAWLNLNKPDSCLHYIHVAEDYYLHKGKETYLLESMPFYLDYVRAEYFVRMQNFEKGIYYIRKAGRYCRQHNLMGELIASNAYECDFLYKSGQYEAAAICIQEMLPFFKQHGLLDQQKFVYRMLRRCYSQLHQYQKADQASKKYVVIDDSIHKLSIKSELNMIRSIAAVYESEAKLHATRKNLQIAQVNNQMRMKQRNTSVLIAISSIVAVLILWGLFLNSKRNKSRLISLHDQLVQKNNEIKENSAQLKHSNQLKDNLFSIISNDLRNPLHQLLNELRVVKDSIEEKHLTIPIENTLKETINLFEGLLEWSKTGEKQNIFSPVKVNLDENVNKIILFYLPEIQAREIKIINKSVALATYADQNIVQTLLRNLIGNAIASVSKDGINGLIEIETNLKENKYIEIVISDSGPGFPTDVLDKFNDEKFDVNLKSKGLGLSICKALTKMSGWKMELDNESKYNGGKVTISVPVYKEKPALKTSEIHKHLSADAQKQLLPLKSLKFYQTSEIRVLIKSLGEITDPSAREWIRLLEQSVHSGDQKKYDELMEAMDKFNPGNKQFQS